MNARRSSILVAILLGLGGLALAQPPVPMFGAPSFAGAATVATPAAAPPVVESQPTSESQQKQRLTAELTALRARRADAEKRLELRARSLYRIHRSGTLPIAGGIDALLARTGRIERIERAFVEDARRLDEYRIRERGLAAELVRATAQAEEAERRQREQSEREAALEASAAYGAVGYGTLPALPVVPMPDAPVALGNVEPAAYVPAPAAPTSGFALLRGRLGLPLTTSIGIRDAVRDDGPGLEFLARPATTVMSVAEGRVAYASEYGSYGRMVILDHGDTFYTIYAGLGRIAARVGDYLPRGGAIGDVAGGSNPALFFEVRRGTRSLDTRNWLGLSR